MGKCIGTWTGGRGGEEEQDQTTVTDQRSKIVHVMTEKQLKHENSESGFVLPEALRQCVCVCAHTSEGIWLL